MAATNSPRRIAAAAAPCDDCRKAALCRHAGTACAAFTAYIKGERWEDVPRHPTRQEGAAHGVCGVAPIRDDGVVWLPPGVCWRRRWVVK